MAKFLNTSGTNYFLEELIKSANDRLILISPFLKLNDRIKELLEDKNRLKIDVRIIYGKNELLNDEITWLSKLTFVRTSFCKNLHAKCYLNEESCIITSLNLYEFSQINNNEMGVSISRTDDAQLYQDTYEEAQRIIRISDEVRISLEKVTTNSVEKTPETTKEKNTNNKANFKLTTAKLAKKLSKKTDQLIQDLITQGYLEVQNDKQLLTEKGKQAGGESKHGRYGVFFLWDEEFTLS
jgi:phosphatidylserine/phosphatidylglycerophosphate/cardiolipin synthase-like enzyme